LKKEEISEDLKALSEDDEDEDDIFPVAHPPLVEGLFSFGEMKHFESSFSLHRQLIKCN
jgi:hypothetical protein